MVKKIIFATGNEHKMTEIRMILEDLGAEIFSQLRGSRRRLWRMAQPSRRMP